MKALFKTALIFGIACSLWQSVYAQQVPLFNQYFTQPSLAYPSSVAFSGGQSLGFFYRGQWSGLEGAPVNFSLNYTNPLNGKLGYDLNVNRFEVGVIQQTYISAGAAYAFKLNDKHKFSVGVRPGLSLLSLNDSRISLESLSDDLIQDLLGNNGTVVSMDLGVSYRFNAFNFDFVAPSLLRESLSDNAYDELSNSNLTDYMLTVGYHFLIDPVNQIYVRPNITWRHQKTIGGNLDVAAQLEIKNKFQASIGYRENYGTTAGVGVKIKPNILFTYQYDFGKSDVPFLSDGFNEIGLQLSFINDQEEEEILRYRGLEVIERLRREEIYDERLISSEDKEAAIYYLSSLEIGKKKQRKQQAEQAFRDILDEIREMGLTRMRAEAAERQRYANGQRESEQKAEEERQRLQEERAEKERLAREEAERLRAQELAQLEAEKDKLDAEYIIVVAAYSPGSKWAKAYLDELKAEYPEAGLFESKKRGYDYVYVLAFNDFNKAIRSMRGLKASGRFPDSWVHVLRLSQ